MKIKYAYIILSILTASVITGCHKEEIIIPPDPLTVENDISEIRFSSGVSEMSFGITAKSDWHLTMTGEGFSAEPAVGKAGTYTITVTSEQQESPETEQTLGNLTIVVDHSPVKHNIRITLPARSKKVVMAYFLGTSLSYYFNRNLEAMKTAVSRGSLGDDRLIILGQSSQNYGAIEEIFYNEREGKSCKSTICKFALPEKLTAESFGDYLKRMMEIAPADNYSLIILGHSKAWLPSHPATATFGIRRRPSWQTADGADVTRDLGERNVLLELDDLKNGLAATGKKFDCIYFDVCFMASTESAYALRDNAEYIIGSPCEIMGEGSPYDRILEPLFANDLAKVCSEYYDYYQYTYPSWKSGCISTIVCGKLDALADAAKRINASQNIAEDFDITAIQPYEGRDDHIFFDTEDYIRRLCTDADLVDGYKKALDECVINRHHTAGFYSAYNHAMTPVTYYSGMNVTPDERCFEPIGSHIARTAESYALKCAERDKLKEELEAQGKEPGTSEQYNSLAREANRLANLKNTLEKQKSILEYYNPSLRLTDWYKATH
ncbi:MAG: hypothetical protein J6K28_02520 [Alistipes sp.]|nr:hypothetical protein [Alistipes sp.]